VVPEIPDVIFRFFASHPAGPMLTFDREVSDPQEGLRESLESFITGFGADDVEAVQADSNFRFFAGHREDQDRAARVWLAERLLAREIARGRLETIREDRLSSRPRPYDLSALEDVPVDDDHLVPLSAFSFNGATLVRNDVAFMVLPTTGSPNSTHWLLAAIYEQGLAERASVRLDPYLWGPSATYPSMFYRMWMYGQPLDWGRIHALQEAEHGRWMPESDRARERFTDYAWMPRGEEVHFVCEEVPDSGVISREAARYLHAIYSKRSQKIEHLDGAIRLYAEADFPERAALHARDAGKQGVREKVFLVEGSQDRDVLGQIAQTFFVWNHDVQKYFSSAFAAPQTP
jgi:hypothetical protein